MYKINHFYEKMDLEIIKNTKIPIYAQQLFYNIAHKLRVQMYGLFVIKSQHKLLNEELQKELIAFNDDGNDMRYSSFFNALSVKKIKVFEEYSWIVSAAELQKIIKGKGNV